MDYSEKRKTFIDWLRACLIGPVSGVNLLTDIHPIDRYPLGVLYPIIRGVEGIDPASDDFAQYDYDSANVDDMDGKENSGTAAVTRKKRRYSPPSSAGFSFYIQGDDIELQVLASAVRYVPSDDRDAFSGSFKKKQWRREPLVFPKEEAINISAPASRTTTDMRFRLFDGKAEIYCLWRPYGNGWLTTLSLCNSSEMTFDTPMKWKQACCENALFEASLSCVIDAGDVGNYPGADNSLLSDEELELELQYKNRHIYAVGHGVATTWKLNSAEQVIEIHTDFMPAVQVPQVTADVAVVETNALKLSYLSNFLTHRSDAIDNLTRFVETYKNWVKSQKKAANRLVTDDYEKKAADRIVKRMKKTVSRMHQGISQLGQNSTAARAFEIANRAMMKQMVQYDSRKGRRKPLEQYHWRPFQLAFLLMTIEPVINEESEFRDVVDLIWFPTGGGKTEAYLGLIAFQIAWRRLTNPSSGSGTTVLMRYTLRLLTTQQYLRATRLICALELIRRKEQDLGSDPITIGMWVGNDASPNTFRLAKAIVDRASGGNGGPIHKLVLDSCPWCLEPLRSPDGYNATKSRFHFRCTNPDCLFGQDNNGVIPCHVVDEALYQSPPTLLVSTVDKFARLAWDERTSAFFGKDGNRPPELIIQDELHLISGALGSVAGLYEAALDTVLIRRGVHPKYIASTATIRMADYQVKRFFGRKVAVFPPPGISFDDSFFAKSVPTYDRPGRLYIGYLAYLLDRRHCMAPLAAALLAAPEIVFDADHVDRKAWLEAWWTQIVYHGSLKGVGNSHNAFNISVKEYFDRYLEEAKKRVSIESEEKAVSLIRQSPPRISQLTSHSSVEDNARTFSYLERHQGEPGCLDVVLATNMISVGLDVARLALMIINGQPLTTAEYIQASSRVGRSDTPGIIFVNYYRDQARSLSHYENFRPYHEGFYRFVEPTSITPYTYQARIRALHAALVISIRHACGSLLPNKAAGSFNLENGCIRAVVETFKQRCIRADAERGTETCAHIDRLTSAWQQEIERCGGKLHYHVCDRDKLPERLLYNHEDSIKGLWPTLQSMRNVEKTTFLKQL